MPKQGEKSRKLKALSHGTSVRPPKKWWDKMKKTVAKEYSERSQKGQARIIGGIWSKSSTATKKKIVTKYQR